MKITNIGNSIIAVETPYNPDFVARIKKAGGKWNSSTKTWNLDVRSIEVVRAIMREVYGQDDMPQELVNVRVHVGEESISEWHGPIVMFGRTVASAFGRDSGARLGEGICFEKGRCKSGGSVKNWETIVEAGSVIVIYDIPQKAVEEKIGWSDSWGTFEVLRSEDPFTTLKTEKEVLLKRLEEINEILKSVE